MAGFPCNAYEFTGKLAILSQVSKRGRLHDVFYKQKHPKYKQLKHCVGTTKTNHVVLQMLSTTFQFLRAFWILVPKPPELACGHFLEPGARSEGVSKKIKT